jgi:hypothetical protein
MGNGEAKSKRSDGSSARNLNDADDDDA